MKKLFSYYKYRFVRIVFRGFKIPELVVLMVENDSSKALISCQTELISLVMRKAETSPLVNCIVQILNCLVDGSQTAQLGELSVVDPLQGSHLVEIFLGHLQLLLPPSLLPSEVLQHLLSARQCDLLQQELHEEPHLQVELREGADLYGHTNEAHGGVVDVDQMFVQRGHSPAGHRHPAVVSQEGEVVVVASGQQDHCRLHRHSALQAQSPVREAGDEARHLLHVGGEDGGEGRVVV